MYELIQSLADEYAEARSPNEVHQSTARLAKQETPAEFGVLAFRDELGVHALASEPAEWTDTDELLSPVSLPTISSAEGQSNVIDDASNVRSAVEGEPASHGTTVTYPSLMWTPFGDRGFLLVGSTSKSAFSELDLGRLRSICSIGSLLSQQMDTSNERAAKLDIEEAASFLTHDAKNLLTVIHGRLELVRDNPTAEHYAVIEKDLERLDELIEDTATLLKTGNHVTGQEPVSLHEAVTSAWDNVEYADAELSAEVRAEMLADESRLRQLLENLFRNAIDHAGPAVTIRVGLLEDEQGFYVADDGPGIPPDERDSLFDLGYTSRDDHTGVGLNIVERIARAHDWEIAVTDAEQGGARFEFSGVQFTAE